MAEKPTEKEKKSNPKLKTNPEPLSGIVEFDENGQLTLPKIGGRYELLELIGSGGMGKVYKALDTETDQIYALKILHADLAKDSVSLKRFSQEIEACSKMNHENLVSVYDQGSTDDGSPFFVMDYIQGITLGELIEKDCEIASQRAIELFIQMCNGLKEAHSKGIIHRDLKPSNILLHENEKGVETIKLADFGIARVANDSINYTQTLTETADIVGSPKYMSPEQCTGLPLDEKSDIYSLGCVMYEVMTKKPPFDGNNAIQIILKQINEEPSSFSKGHSKDSQYSQMDNVITKCLFKEPSDRYRSIDDLLTDLKTVQNGLKVSVYRKSDFKLFGLVAGMIVAFALVSIAWSTYNINSKPQSTSNISTTTAPITTSRWDLKTENQVANQMQTMAFLHFKKRSYKQAIPALKYVAETYKKGGQKYGEYFAYQCIGQCYLSLNKYKEAEPWYKKAVDGMLSLYGNDLRRIDNETRSGYAYVLIQVGKDTEAKVILKSLSLENLESLKSFYERENLNADARRVENQIIEAQK